MIASEPSPIPEFGSLAVPLSELALDRDTCCSLGLFDFMGFLRDGFAGDADTGEGRGC